jgi:hypothetical protein
MHFLSRAALVALLSISSLSFAQQIRGDYIESRSADVYVAQCFANGETGLNGKQALLAWKIDSGSWNGVNLDGLQVAGGGDSQRDPRRPLRRSLSGKGGNDGG